MRLLDHIIPRRNAMPDQPDEGTPGLHPHSEQQAAKSPVDAS